MNVHSVSTFLFNDQSRADLARLQRELFDLQRQIGSGYKADDLKGYGDASSRILNAKGLIAKTDAHNEAAKGLASRLDLVDQSLSHVSDASEALRLAVLNAVANDDGRFLGDALQTQFDAARTALNVDFEGEALFAGERTGADPIAVATLDDLAATASIDDAFDEAARKRTMDIGSGPIPIADKASDVSRQLFDTMRGLKQLIDANGGTLPKPLTDAQRAALQGFATDLSAARQTVLEAQGRNGQLANHVDNEVQRLTAQSDTLAKVVSDAADADLAEVAARLNAVQVQYQAVGHTYAALSQMSLLDYLD